MIVSRQLNIKDKEGHFFTNMININDFDPGLLHVHRIAIDHDFIVYDVKYVKSLDRVDSLYVVFNDLDATFRKSGKDRYLIISSKVKNELMLENCTEIFDDIADQIELMSDNDNKLKYYKDIMRIKFKTNDDLVFNEMMNTPVCVIVASSVFKENEEYYPQITLHDCFYEKEVFQKTLNSLLVFINIF